MTEETERGRLALSLREQRDRPVSSQLRLLCELVTTAVTGATGLGPQPTFSTRRTRRKRRKRRRIDPVDLIKDPTVPYATGYFAAPSEIVGP